MPNPLTPNTYSALRKAVHDTLLLGQREIEKAKVQTYWRTGKLISDHLLNHDSRSDHYGMQVVEKLSNDLEVSTTTLWRCVQFARAFKILATSRESFPAQLTWSHYVELVKVPDEETRLSLLRRAEEGDWTARELAQKIQQEVRPDDAPGESAPAPVQLVPRRGKLYTYRLVGGSGGKFAVDVGFKRLSPRRSSRGRSWRRGRRTSFTPSGRASAGRRTCSPISPASSGWWTGTPCW